MSNIADKIIESDLQDLLLGRSKTWYFVTPDEFIELARTYNTNTTFRCELIITSDPEKTGRQLDAHEIVNVIDTYPSYPRVLPR